MGTSMTRPEEMAFNKQRIGARNVDPQGQTIEKPVEIRTRPITGRTCRITIARSEENE